MITTHIDKLNDGRVCVKGSADEIMMDLTYVFCAIEQLDAEDEVKDVIFEWASATIEQAKKRQLKKSVDEACEKMKKINAMDTDPDGGVFDE